MNETTEPLRERYQAQLGTEFGAAFHGLRNDWAWGLMRANEFRELFSRAEKRYCQVNVILVISDANNARSATSNQ